MHRRQSILLVGALALGSVPTPVLEDVAPLTSPGSLVNPTSSTPVQMWNERVLLDMTGLLMPEPRVHVVATFRMRNTATSEQRIRVRFPLQHPEGSDPIEDLSIEVDFAPVPTTDVLEPSYWQEADNPIHWAAFDVAFPIGTDVIITAQYHIRPRQFERDVDVDYVLETGAGWFGPIESAQIVVRLPYRNCMATCISYAPSWPSPSYHGEMATWTRWNLDPTRGDNFRITLLSPSVWSEILRLETAAANHVAAPEDYMTLADDYRSLGIYRDVSIVRPDLVRLADTTMRRGLAAYPESAELAAWAADRAFFTWSMILGTAALDGRNPTTGELAELRSIRHVLRQLLLLYPEDTRLQQNMWFVERYPWPTVLAP